MTRAMALLPTRVAQPARIPRKFIASVARGRRLFLLFPLIYPPSRFGLPAGPQRMRGQKRPPAGHAPGPRGRKRPRPPSRSSPGDPGGKGDGRRTWRGGGGWWPGRSAASVDVLVETRATVTRSGATPRGRPASTVFIWFPLPPPPPAVLPIRRETRVPREPSVLLGRRRVPLPCPYRCVPSTVRCTRLHHPPSDGGPRPCFRSCPVPAPRNPISKIPAGVRRLRPGGKARPGGGGGSAAESPVSRSVW